MSLAIFRIAKNNHIAKCACENLALYIQKLRNEYLINVDNPNAKMLHHPGRQQRTMDVSGCCRITTQIANIIIVLLCILHSSWAQCPWGRDPLAVSLQATCLCSVNPESGGALSVQCQATNFEILMQALQTYTTGANTVIENLYVNNSRVVLGNDFEESSGAESKGRLTDFMFKNLKIINLQITFGDLTTVSANAFRGLENTLQVNIHTVFHTRENILI